MTRRCVVWTLAAATLLPLSLGCAKQRPPVVEAQGVVLLNQQPLPNAVVEFYPELDDFGTEMKSLAVTDEKGHFTLKCNWQDQPGAAVAKHRVVVYEAPAPGTDPNTRRERGSSPKPLLPNRPIPTKYAAVGSTPLEIEVKPDQKEYKVELTRD